jgi:chromosome segregation ATPase
MPTRAVDAPRAMTPLTEGLSSSSSSSDDHREFHNLVRRANEARQRYSDATREVSRLERYLKTVRVALEATERETAAMQVAAADAQARIVGKDASTSCCLIHCSSSLTFLPSCCQRWRSS